MHRVIQISTYTSKFLSIKSPLMWIGTGIGIAVGFIFGSPTLFYTLVGLMILDVFMGICASLVKGDNVTSGKLQETTYKALAYFSILLTCACIGVVFPPVGWLHTAAIGWIILGEGISVLENCEVVLGRRIPFLRVLKRKLEMLQGNGKSK